MESPADVVAVLDPHVSSVGDSVNRPDPANVLQNTERQFEPGSPSARP